jgi:membrane associated rhomboid family serine protease
MSDEGVRLIMRAALVIALIIAAAFFRALVGPGKERGRIMLTGTLGGFISGVLLSYPIHQRFDMDVSVISASLGIVLGWAVAWTWARRLPRESH